MQVAKTVNERISKYAQVTLESCAYAGTGNVLKIQQLLAQAGEHIELKEEESWKVSCQPFVCAVMPEMAAGCMKYVCMLVYPETQLHTHTTLHVWLGLCTS